MKNHLFLIFITIAFLSCEKKEVESDIVLADEVVGEYLMLTVITTESETLDLPFTDENGVIYDADIFITQRDETTVDLKFTLYSNDNGTNFSDVENKDNLVLSKTQEGYISLSKANSGEEVALVIGNEIVYFQQIGEDTQVFQGNKIK